MPRRLALAALAWLATCPDALADGLHEFDPVLDGPLLGTIMLGHLALRSWWFQRTLRDWSSAVLVACASALLAAAAVGLAFAALAATRVSWSDATIVLVGGAILLALPIGIECVVVKKASGVQWRRACVMAALPNVLLLVPTAFVAFFVATIRCW